MRRFLVITLCILFSLSLLSDYSIASSLIYADISPPNEYINETLIALVNMGSLYVDSTPRGASIYLDNIYEGETPRRIDSIPAGIHTLRLSKDGYRDYVQQVRIDAQQTANIQISLTPGYSLTVNSTPRGAMVYIDGIFKGITPVSTPITSGYHSVRLVLEGYLDYQDSIRVTGDTNLNISLQIGEGSLVVFSEPSSADVYVDDKYYGRTPITIQKIPAGKRMVTVRLSGYTDWSDEVVIEPGKIGQVNVKLKLAGTLQVSSSPPGAKVYLNGKDIGETPLSNSNIPEGTHNLSVELFGYKPWQGIIEVSPGQITNISARLESASIGISDIDISPQPYKVKTLFKRDLSIKFNITRPAMVTVEIRDVNDKLIATPMAGFKASTPKLDVKWRGDLSPGNYKVVVIAIDENGNQVGREAIFRAEEESFLVWILVGLLGILVLWLLF
ncbi:TPA: PEGA domain-containing protein [bacterium]|nr:PEGA domain-containing protein [bacterium]